MKPDGNADGLFLDEICISPAVWTRLWPSATGRPAGLLTTMDPPGFGPGYQMGHRIFFRAKSEELPFVASDRAGAQASARRVGEDTGQ